MAEKYLSMIAGIPTQKEAITTSSGEADAGKIPGLNAGGHLDESMMPPGIGADTADVVASENLGDGNYVNIWNDAGTAKVRKADASTVGKESHGFVRASFEAGQAATIYFEGTNNHVTGLTPGPQFLSTTPGLATHEPPAGSGNVVQRIGYATSPNSMNYQSQMHVVLA